MEKTLNYNIDMSPDSKWEFITPSVFAKDNILYMQEVGRFISGPKYYTKREGLDSFLIKLTLNGRGVLEYCGEKYILNHGEFFFIDCTAPQKYFTEQKINHWDVIWVHFNGKTARAYYEAFLASNQGKPVAMDLDGECSRLLFRLLSMGECYMDGGGNDIASSALLTELLYYCINGCVGRDKPLMPDFVKNAIKYIGNNFDENINLDSLSKASNISKFHLQREFTRCIGMSPSDYICNIRISKSKELLRSTEMPVIEVSASVGMDYAYFVHVFKKNVGLTPLQYRKQWAEIK